MHETQHTPVRDLCIRHRQPKILEASNFCPGLRTNMVSYRPLTQTDPESPFLGDFKKV